MRNACVSILLLSQIRAFTRVQHHVSVLNAADSAGNEYRFVCACCVCMLAHIQFMQPLFYIGLLLFFSQIMSSELAHSPNMAKTLDCSLVSCSFY